MPQTFENIDYSEMITELNFDLQNGYASDDTELYIIRQKNPVFVEKCSKEIFAVVDYFYAMPALSKEVSEMTILEAKKACFSAIDMLEAEDAPNKDALKEAVSLLNLDLKNYTKGNNKRNDRTCRVVFTAEPKVPMMLYFEDEEVADTLEKVTASELLSELKSCS